MVRGRHSPENRVASSISGNWFFSCGAPKIGAEGDKVRFLSVFGSMKAGEIKKVLKDNNLATRVDMTGKSVEQLVDMLYTRAARKVGERKSSMF